jgi:hypothetical protein
MRAEQIRGLVPLSVAFYKDLKNIPVLVVVGSHRTPMLPLGRLSDFVLKPLSAGVIFFSYTYSNSTLELSQPFSKLTVKLPTY